MNLCSSDVTGQMTTQATQERQLSEKETRHERHPEFCINQLKD